MVLGLLQIKQHIQLAIIRTLQLLVISTKTTYLLDIVVANYGDKTVGVLLGYGNGSFEDQTTYSTGSEPLFVVTGNFNKDTLLDIVLANSADNHVGLLLGYSNIAFVKQMMLETGDGSRPRAFAISDFNNDDRMDIDIANSGTNNVGIFLQYDNSTFASQSTYSTGSSPYSVAVVDFNNDT